MTSVSFPVPESVKDLCWDIKEKGGVALIVGGWVRDQVMGLSSKDIDIEVFFLDADTLSEIASGHGKTSEVGESFGVLKVVLKDGLDVDLSLPRRENKSGRGHKGFVVRTASDMSFQEAASRRDFTMNSMGFDPVTGLLHDPFGGMDDIRRGVLRHTSGAFSEDPLRVLRAMQFAARFDMTLDPSTVDQCREMLDEFDTLATERIREEFIKMMTKGKKVSRGIDVLRATGWIVKFPEVAVLFDTPQEPKWHPEGDVGTHTMMVVDRVK